MVNYEKLYCLDQHIATLRESNCDQNNQAKGIGGPCQRASFKKPNSATDYGDDHGQRLDRGKPQEQTREG